MFFDNGGGQCYVVSTGDYAATIALGGAAGTPGLREGLDALALEDEPTLIVIPEAVRLNATDYAALAQAVLDQCNRLRDRFAIFDLRDGEGPAPLRPADLATNRAHFGNNHLRYGAAYYPFVRTAMSHYVREDQEAATSNVRVTLGSGPAVDLAKLRTGAAEVPATGTPPTGGSPAVARNTAAYNFVKAALKDRHLVMPPSGAVAGVYAATDTARGVWKAPANVSLVGVVEPTVRVDTVAQDQLNVDADSGKSVNALRAFAGKGTLVWGARTLAGNDNEWRYVSVRRFFNMVEESVKKSTHWAVFEPNDANTWVKVRGMIESYLTQKWREGALAGATTKEAFFVRCGLGVTMSAQDILEGRMIVEIGLAVVRPAEFIILRFSHKLQTS
jgi:phage tail sheath protein FI